MDTHKKMIVVSRPSVLLIRGMHVANQQQPRLVVLTKGKNIIIKPETGQQTNQQASPYSSSFFPIAC